MARGTAACIFAFALAASGSPAWAMMPPAAYEEALAEAEIHIQLAITGRTLIAPEEGHGACIVSGIVVAAFRGPRQIGEALSATVPCRHAGSEIPAGGTVFTPVEALAQAGFIELVLEPGAGITHRVAAEGMGAMLIEAPSPTPAMAGRFLQQIDGADHSARLRGKRNG